MASPKHLTLREAHTMQDTTLLIDVTEAARRLGCGRTTIYQLMATGALETVKVGRLRRVPVDALSAYIAERREAFRVVA